MSKGTEQQTPRRVSWRKLGDAIVTVALLVAAATVIAKNLPGGRNGGSGRPELVTIPEAPLTIAGARTRGTPSARVALIEFLDYECPYCRKFDNEILPAIEKEYIATGKVLLVLRHFPLAMHPFAPKAAQAAECAGNFGLFWEMHDGLLRLDGALNDLLVQKVASEVGLEASGFDKCYAQPSIETVDRDIELARQLDVRSTPTFFVGSILPDGTVRVTRAIPGALPIEEFIAALDAALVR